MACSSERSFVSSNSDEHGPKFFLAYLQVFCSTTATRFKSIAFVGNPIHSGLLNCSSKARCSIIENVHAMV